MLPKQFRLSKKRDFELVFKRGKSIKGNGFILNFLEKGNEDLKIGFIVSLKVHKKATRRNKLKRRMREATRANLEKIKRGFLIVIVALPEAVNFSYQQIKENLEKLFQKANLFNND